MHACPILITPRLILREPEMDDAPVIYELMQDSAISANMPAMPSPFSIGAAQGFIEQAHQALIDETGFQFAIVLKPENCVIGAIGLDLNDVLQEAKLHFWLGHPYRRFGYMTESIQRVYQFSFEILRLHRMSSVALAQNGPMIRLLSRVGMVFERIQYGYYHQGDIPIKANIYNIYRMRYEKLKQQWLRPLPV